MTQPGDDVDVLVVGAGQAGLGTAYWVRRRADVRLRVLDAAPVGSSWLDRWDSLHLFTPRRFSALPGLAFPPGPTRSPSRTEVAAYLQEYARRFALPVETGRPVTRLHRSGGRFVAETPSGPVRANQVVLAPGPFGRPHVPPAADRLDPSVTQLHSAGYARPADLPPGPVLVVGGGNSAAQLAVELAATHPVTVASPGPPWYLPEDPLGVSLYWWLLLTGALNAGADSRLSRYVRRRGDAIVGTDLRALTRSGAVRLLPSRLVDADGRTVVLQDGTRLPVSTVLWCTGHRPALGWVDLSGALDEDGGPVHESGASPAAGLHWMGLPWQTRLNSSIIDGVDRDARRTARRVLAGLAGAT